MTMTQVKEQQSRYLDQFERFERGGDGGPAWLLPIRKAAFARFTELGFPTTKHEEWRYTNVSPIAQTEFAQSMAPNDQPGTGAVEPFSLGAGAVITLVNGRYVPALSSSGNLPDGVVVESLAAAFERGDALLEQHLAPHVRFEDQAFVALNTALMDDGAFVHVPAGVVVKDPIHILYVSVAGETPHVAHPRNVFVVDERAEATLVETYVGLSARPYLTNAVTELVAGDGATVDHHKIQREASSAFHIASLQMHQFRDTNVSSHNMSFGGGLVRNDVNALLDGEGGYATMTGLSLLDGTRHVDNHLYVDHAKPHCGSREFYKAIVDDQGVGVFSGRIIVREDAQKTDAKQTNQSLLLSPDARIESKPQLEIFADDVKCTHGATVGQLDDEALFYLRSRGLAPDTAKSLLLYAFADQNVHEIKLDPLRAQLERLLLEWLPQGVLLKNITAP